MIGMDSLGFLLVRERLLNMDVPTLSNYFMRLDILKLGKVLAYIEVKS